MRKLSFLLCSLLLMIMPTIVNADNNDVAEIGSNKYTTLSDAVAAVTAGQTITILQNTTGSNLTLPTGVTLNIPLGITMTLTGSNTVPAGTIIRNNGTIVVDDGYLDVSKLTYGNNGLIPNQDGTISIKDHGKVMMLESWELAYAPSNESTILTNTENGGVMTVGESTYIYQNNTWVGAIKVTNGSTDTYYKTFPLALENVTDGNTITLLTDINMKQKQTISKNLTLKLNGHVLSTTNRVLTIEHANVTIDGPGTIKENVADYAPIVVKGSNTASDTNYTNVTINKDVKLEGWSGIFLTPYASSGAPYAYGVKVDFYGEINAVNDSVDAHGNAIYINGQIKHKTNYPVINVHDGAVIKSTGTTLFVAGYSEINIGKATMVGVDSGLGIKSGIISINGANIKCIGDDLTPTAINNNGIDPSGAAIQIESNNGYAKDIELTINSGKIISEKGYAVYEYTAEGSTPAIKTLSITGGEFISGVGKTNFLLSNSLESSLSPFITGGKYTTNVTKYVKAGYKLNYSNNVYEAVQANITEGSRTISGIITNGEEATVQLIKGNTVIQSTKAVAGEYSFIKVAAGVYNLVFINGEQNTMKLVTVKDTDLTINATIPVRGNTTYNLKTDNIDIAVGGLEEVSPGHDVEFNVELKSADTNSTSQVAIKDTIKEKDVVFFDMEMLIDDEAVSNIDNVLQIVIPFNFNKKDDIELIRYHDGEVEKFELLTSKPTDSYKDKTYYLDKENNLIYVYTSKFSTYAVAYKDATNNPKTFDNIGMFVITGLLSLTALAYITIQTKKKMSS